MEHNSWGLDRRHCRIVSVVLLWELASRGCGRSSNVRIKASEEAARSNRSSESVGDPFLFVNYTV